MIEKTIKLGKKLSKELKKANKPAANKIVKIKIAAPLINPAVTPRLINWVIQPSRNTLASHNSAPVISAKNDAIMA